MERDGPRPTDAIFPLVEGASILFRGLGNLMSMLRNASQLSQRLEKVSERLKRYRAEGAAGGGMVRVECDGMGNLVRCQIDPSLLCEENRELLEDLVVAAANEAMEKARAYMAQATQEQMGAILPDLNELIDPEEPDQ